MTEGQISDILLAKSEVLVNAEIKLKRQRIEKELKRQVEEKRQLAMSEGEECVDLEKVMEKVGLSAVKSIRPDMPVQEDVDMQTGEPAPGPDTHLLEAFRKPPTGPAAMSVLRDQEPVSRDLDSEMRSYNTRGTIPERVYSPPARPRYSATSQLRSPAAPQPVRPANMARVESQDPRMIIEVDEEVSYGRYPENTGRAPYRSRVSPVPYIKPEPASPGYREPALRVQTPDRGRPPSRLSQYDSGGRLRYDYPYIPSAGYYAAPPPPPPVPVHRPYNPYREADPYAYPPQPVDYARRSYTPAYVPPVTSVYPPPRPVHDEYDRRYPPPPSVPARQPSRIGRRSASPSGPYRHPRHSSRSASPAERGRRVSPRPLHADYRPQSRMPPSPPRIDQYGRPMPLPPATTQRGSDVYVGDYGHPFAPPRERPVYGDGGTPYYPPLVPARYDESPRPESSITTREADMRSYRDREYSYPAAVARQSLSHPPLPGSGYPPSLFNDYTRAPSRAASRAPMGPPSELVDYSRGGGDRVEYHDRALARPDERERDYGGRTSVRPDERGGYLPVRHASVRPEAARGYGDREYATMRQPSVRPEGRRDEQYMEPPPLMGGFGVRDSGQMQPPRLPVSYAGSEYGDSRYAGKY